MAVLTVLTTFGQLLPAVLPSIFDAAALAGFPGANGVIAFQHQVTVGGADFDIWTMNADGSAKTQLTSGPAIDGAAAMSPFGDRIAFQRARPDFDTQLWVMNVDGTSPTRLLNTDGWDDTFPAWSPDGRFIAFVSNRFENDDIWVVDTSNGTSTAIITDGLPDRQPSWSPDGTKIAFDRGDNGTRQIYVANAGGSGATAVTTGANQDNTDPNWSPDGTKIVFTSFRDGNREVYVMNADGSGQTNISNNASFDADPAWSPAGDRIVFTSIRTGDFEVYSVTPTGASLTALTATAGSDTFPDWGPTATLRQIRGHVSLPTGGPAANVTVRALVTDGGAVRGTTTTDSKGDYRLGVPRGEYHVVFTPPTQTLAVQVYDGQMSTATGDPVLVNDGNALGIDAVLQAAHLVTGMVTSAEAAVPNAIVLVYDAESCCYLIRQALTNEAGNYTIGLAPGSYRVRFAKVGFTAQWWDHKNTPADVRTGWLAADTLNVNDADVSGVDASLTVAALVGVAACWRPIGDGVFRLMPLPATTVTLLSGSTVIGTTRSDADAAYRFTGLGPNAPLTVEYGATVSGAVVSCNVNVTTDDFGGGRVPDATRGINHGNHTWITAYRMTSASPVSDVIDRPFRRTFYKLAVKPQQIVTVQLTNLTRNYQLLGYSDIRKAADRLLASTGSLKSVRNLVASGAVSAGDLDSGDLDSGDLDSGDLDSGDLDSGDLDSGDLDSGDLDSGDLDSGDLDSGDLDSGDLDSGDLDSGTVSVYQSAQRAALRYASGKGGTAPEGFTIHTRGYDGDLYFAVLGHDGVFDSSGTFQIMATAISESAACDTAPLLPMAPSPIPLPYPNGKRTLILTNTKALGLDATTVPTKENYLRQLRDFATAPALNGFAVNGFVYDLDDNANVKTMLASVAASANCVPQVNLATETIKALIWGPGSFQDPSASTLEYVVFAGGDRAIPFRRITDLTFAGEINYSPPVEGVSAASLANNWYLTDSFYLAASPVERKGQLIWLNEVTGGRLVETATDILKNVDVYTAKGGVLTPTSSLVAGYQFNTDLVDELQTGLQASGASPVRLPDDIWGAADLRNQLLVPNAPHYDVIAPQAHFTATRLVPADNGQRLLSTEVAGVADKRFEGTVWLTIGCHSGYNIVDADATDFTIPVAFPEAILGKGGFLYGGTGYQFGDDEILANTELLLTNVMNEWRYRQDSSFTLYLGGQVPLGKALSNARSTYLNGLRSVRDIDRKVADVATFYGLPFYRVALSSGRLNRPQPTPLSTIAIGTAGLSYRDVGASFTLNPNLGGGGGTFFDAGSRFDVASIATRPILPRKVTNVSGVLGAVATLPHGVVLRDAAYTTVVNRPVLSIPVTEDSVAQPATFLNSQFSPWMFDLNVLGGDQLVFTPAQYLSDANGLAGQLRKYSSIGTRVYYSTRTDGSALFGSPLVRGLTLTDVGARVHVDVTLFTLGPSTVQAAMFTYTGTAAPLSTLWKTVDLVNDAPVAVQGVDVLTNLPIIVGHLQHWHTVATGPAASLDIDPKNGVGSSPATVTDVFGVLQGVGDTGDVVVDTNQMRLYSIPREPATAAAPKIPTTLAFTTPPASPTTYGASVLVAARLASPGVSDIGGKRVIFRLGRTSVSAITGADGSVSATVPINVLPGEYQLQASFAEDDTALGSSTQAPLTVGMAVPAFVPATLIPPVQYSDNVALAVLRTSTGELLRWQPIILTRLDLAGTDPLRRVASFSDGTGTVRLDTMDFGGLGAGTYPIVARFPSDGLRFMPATSGTFNVTVERERATIEGPSPQQTGSVIFQSTVVQDGPPADRAPGDLTRAGISYALKDESGAIIQSGTTTAAADGTWSFTRTVAPGVYTVVATITGDYFTGGGTAIAVVYDPTTFGTGGGYVLTTNTTQPTVAPGKKANFGFNVKYKDGTIIPTGSLLFQLKEANIDLKVTFFDWLIISVDGAGKKADFQAHATINGSGNYTVHVIARDLPSGDMLSIEVRDAANNVVVSIPSGPVAGGSIKVH